MNQSPLPTPWWPPLLYILWWECGHPELTFWFCSQLVPPAVHYARYSPWPIAFSYWGGRQCFQDDCSLAVFHSIHLTQGKVNPPCLSNCRISACFYCGFSLSHQCKGAPGFLPAPELSVWEPGCSFLDTKTLRMIGQTILRHHNTLHPGSSMGPICGFLSSEKHSQGIKKSIPLSWSQLLLNSPRIFKILTCLSGHFREEREILTALFTPTNFFTSRNAVLTNPPLVLIYISCRWEMVAGLVWLSFN